MKLTSQLHRAPADGLLCNPLIRFASHLHLLENNSQGATQMVLFRPVKQQGLAVPSDLFISLLKRFKMIDLGNNQKSVNLEKRMIITTPCFYGISDPFKINPYLSPHV